MQKQERLRQLSRRSVPLLRGKMHDATPSAISAPRTPCEGQHGERRDDRDEKKNVIQIHEEEKFEVRCLMFDVKRAEVLSILLCESPSPIISTSFLHGVSGPSRLGRN